MRVFLHLILTANWEPKKWHGSTIERGQRVYSRAKLASELKISEKSVRTAINHLISTGEVANRSTREYSVITIKNYESYQQAANESANEGPTTGQRVASDGPQLKNDKNDKNDKKDTTPASRPEKHKYGEYKNVLLSDTDIEKLKAKFSDWQERIETLSKGIELKGYKYKNHYLAILKWAERDEQKRPPQKEHASTFDSDIEAFEKSGIFDKFDREGKT